MLDVSCVPGCWAVRLLPAFQGGGRLQHRRRETGSRPATEPLDRPAHADGTEHGSVRVADGRADAGDSRFALTDALGINAPGAKAVFYGLALMVIITLRPSGVWPWLARLFALTERRL